MAFEEIHLLLHARDIIWVWRCTSSIRMCTETWVCVFWTLIDESEPLDTGFLFEGAAHQQPEFGVCCRERAVHGEITEQQYTHPRPLVLPCLRPFPCPSSHSLSLFYSVLGCVLPLQEAALRQSPPSFSVL